ncbi:EamA family transporter, partial [Mycobacterium tuberculosis]|nr:EamA family transporter [Mycobacterium tuberculosis]
MLWGLNFIAIHYVLLELPPLFFSGLRFAIAALPIVFVPRPRIAWRDLSLLALTLFTLQFAFLFPGRQIGFPPG